MYLHLSQTWPSGNICTSLPGKLWNYASEYLHACVWVSIHTMLQGEEVMVLCMLMVSRTIIVDLSQSPNNMLTRYIHVRCTWHCITLQDKEAVAFCVFILGENGNAWRWKLDASSRWDWLDTLNKVWLCIVLILHTPSNHLYTTASVTCSLTYLHVPLNRTISATTLHCGNVYTWLWIYLTSGEVAEVCLF